MDADAVNLAERLVLWSNGQTTSITRLYGNDGETDDPDEAVIAVAPLPNHEGWATIDLRDYREMESH